MRITEMEEQDFAEDRFPNMVLIRAWQDCRIWSAGVEEALLVLVDDAKRRVAVFEYDSAAERENDIRLVRHLPDEEGGAEGGVPARLNPSPPGRAMGSAEPLL